MVEKLSINEEGMQSEVRAKHVFGEEEDDQVHLTLTL